MSADIVNLDSGYFTVGNRITKSNATSAVTYSGGFSITGATGLGSSITGTAGNVTQATSITTSVTANSDLGTITTVNTTTGAVTNSAFTVNNSVVTANSIVLLTIDNYSGTLITDGIPVVSVGTISSGSFVINLTNVHASNAMSGIVKISYLVIN